MRPSKKTELASILFAATMLLPFSGCEHSNEVSGGGGSPTTVTSGPTVTPTPPGGALAGSWNGFYDEEDYKGSSADCHTHVNASAQLAQSGAQITGSFAIDPNACWRGGQIQGTVSGNAFTGNVLLPGYSGGAFSGTATSTEIRIDIQHLSHDNGDGTGIVAPGGNLTLTR
jgi:hypothetical protein